VLQFNPETTALDSHSSQGILARCVWQRNPEVDVAEGARAEDRHPSPSVTFLQGRLIGCFGPTKPKHFSGVGQDYDTIHHLTIGKLATRSELTSLILPSTDYRLVAYPASRSRKTPVFRRVAARLSSNLAVMCRSTHRSITPKLATDRCETRNKPEQTNATGCSSIKYQVGAPGRG